MSVGLYSLINSTKSRSNDASSHSALDSYTHFKKYQGFSAEKLLRAKLFCDTINMYLTIFANLGKKQRTKCVFCPIELSRVYSVVARAPFPL